MAESVIFNNSNRITTSGVYTFDAVVCPCYTTGSGNYFKISLPASIAKNLQITDVVFNGTTNIYVGSQIIYGTNIKTPALSTYNIQPNYVLIECQFKTTQTANLGGVLATDALVVTIS